jgi:hypothetical protein
MSEEDRRKDGRAEDEILPRRDPEHTDRRENKLMDRKEQAVMMEPLLVSESSRHRSELADLAITLTEKSASQNHGGVNKADAGSELLLLQSYRRT